MRICNHCGKELKLNGYVVDNGLEYYCCDQCLNAHYTPEEWAKMYDNGDGDSYWTEWEEEKGMNEYTICITETLQHSITIKADTEEQAIEKVQKMYDNCEIVLDYNDFVEVNIDNIENL
jgi:hypothetical protein